MRKFPTFSVISVYTGRSVVDGPDEIIELLSYMAGQELENDIDLLTKLQNPASQVLLLANPKLRDLNEEVAHLNPGTVVKWRTIWALRYGETLNVPQLTASERGAATEASKLGGPVLASRLILPKNYN